MINLKIVNAPARAREDLKRLLNQVFVGVDSRVCLHGQPWTPQMDIHETQTAYVLVAEMTGLDPSEIQLMVDHNHVVVSGCRQQKITAPRTRVHQVEIDYGPFERAFHFPTPIVPEKVEAASEHGMLTVILPKQEQPSTRIGIVSA